MLKPFVFRNGVIVFRTLAPAGSPEMTGNTRRGEAQREEMCAAIERVRAYLNRLEELCRGA